MKRLMLASILMFLSVTLCMFENTFLNHSISTLEEHIEQAETEFLNNNKTYTNYTNNTLKYWQEKQFWLEFFINDEQIEEITSELLTLNNADSKSDFLNSAAQIKFMLNNLKKSEILNIY